MSKDFLDEDKNIENALEQNCGAAESVNEDFEETEKNDNAVEAKEAVLKPRKRKIVRNCQLLICVVVVAALFLILAGWKLFFNQSLVGTWHYNNFSEYTETYDDPTATPDGVTSETTEYSQRVCYEFTNDGRCIVTLGTMSVTGQYSLYAAEEGNMFSAVVYYNYMPLLYGSYKYEIKGNIFTGRKLVITDTSTGEKLELEQGEGENPLVPIENTNIDDRIVGTWKDDTYGATYNFGKDGYMTLDNGDGMVVEQVYTVDEEDGFILVKYVGATEQSYSYIYSFDDDGNLNLNDSVLKRVE